jgi:4-amino-4-deoxy-L-arabinose transferase-like glycosyltransferase
MGVALSFALQVAGIFLVPRNDQPLWDPLEYATLARNLYEHGQYGINRGDFPNFSNWAENPSRIRQPLYPLYLIVFYWLPGKNLRVLQISQVFLNLGTLCCVFVLARRIFQGRLWAGTPIALSLYFPVWFTSAFMITESLFTFLLALSMLLLQRSLNGGGRAAWFVASSGGLLGLAFLVRPVALVVCICGAFLLVLYNKARRGILFGLIMVTACVVVTLPWAFRNYVAMGELTPFSTEGGANLFQGTCLEKSREWGECDALAAIVVARSGFYKSESANRDFRELALARIRSHPLWYPAKGAVRVARMWAYFPGSFASRISAHRPLFVGLNIVHFCILLTAVLGLNTVEARWRALLPLPVVGLTLPTFGMLQAVSRYVVPAMPFLLVFSCQGAARVAHSAAHWIGRNPRPSAVRT